MILTNLQKYFKGFQTRAKCKIRMINLVSDHADDGILAHKYAN